MKTINNQGQTIVESLVALGLISMIGLIFFGGLVQLRKTTTDSLRDSATDRQIADIAENIKAGVQKYQVNFNLDKASVEYFMKPEELPMAWDVGVVAEKSQCEKCQGRYGYMIQPYDKYRGLYLVTLRLTHTSWLPSEPYRDYNFLVSAK